MRYYNYIFGVLMLVMSIATHSATVNLTAKFTPAINNSSSDGIFINTTPNSGYCKKWPAYCGADLFGVDLPIDLTQQYPIPAFNQRREGVFFGLPKKTKNLLVRNTETGEAFDLSFRISQFSALVSKGNDSNWLASESNQSSSTNWDYPTNSGSGCSRGSSSIGSNAWTQFLWKALDNTNPCFLISKIVRPLGSHQTVSRLTDLSFGYTLVAKNSLLTVSSGTYVGQLSFTVGPGGDFDFGDNYQASDSIVNINMTLSVNHDLVIKTSPDDRLLTLQPCKNGKVCTPEQGRNNWERWMISRVTPEMTAKSNFQLSSSGAFTVYLQCEYQQGENCALKSDKNGQLVPMQSYLTLPDNIIAQQTNSHVTRAPMLTRKDTSNLFLSKNSGSNRKGSIDFLIKQRDVDTMLETRPDTYRGVVTVIFDPNIYGL